MKIKDARAALRKALEAQTRLDQVQRMIARDNGDIDMIGYIHNARESLELGIRRLCRVVPNADLIHGRNPILNPVHTESPDRKTLASGRDTIELESDK